MAKEEKHKKERSWRTVEKQSKWGGSTREWWKKTSMNAQIVEEWERQRNRQERESVIGDGNREAEEDKEERTRPRLTKQRRTAVFDEFIQY